MLSLSSTILFFLMIILLAISSGLALVVFWNHCQLNSFKSGPIRTPLTNIPVLPLLVVRLEHYDRAVRRRFTNGLQHRDY